MAPAGESGSPLLHSDFQYIRFSKSSPAANSSVSSGAAFYNATNQLSVEELLEKADRELYKVKREKRLRRSEKQMSLGNGMTD